MSKKSCGNCRFWLGERERNGECRRNPPFVVDDDGEFKFPEMSIDDWCGEWRSKDATGASGKFYQLPNGQWITAADVTAIVARPNPSPRVGVCFFDGSPHEIRCDSMRTAEAMRDKIAADVNAMVGGAA